MKPARREVTEIVFAPNLRGADELANHWMRQATLRSRREIAWLWHERGHRAPTIAGELPPIVDKASDSLDLSRHWAEKRKFFGENVAAHYLSEKLQTAPPVLKKRRRGSFAWVVHELQLDEVASFALGLGLAAAFDATFGAVIATCLNDHARTYPNLMLIQRLWDSPEDALVLADPLHVLFGHGLLRRSSVAQRSYAETFWEQPLTVPPLIARELLSAHPIAPAGLELIEPRKEPGATPDKAGELMGYRLESEKATRLRVVPLLGNKRSAYRQAAAAVSSVTKRAFWEYRGAPALPAADEYLNTLVTLCWLQDRDLLVDHGLFDTAEKNRPRNDGLPPLSVPVTLFAPISEHLQVRHIDAELLLPVLKIPTLSYEGRLAAWREEFGRDATALDATLTEVARRFRYERATIRQIAAEIKALPGTPTEDDLIAACRAELGVDMGDLAAYVEPRFKDERLILPKKQSLQFQEQLGAMASLTKVHYGWGTAQAWNEGGITVLFAGPPGTGKTMAAEIMARELKLPMYRIDLSQVVNKYIGETEKNLKRVFDAAEVSDMVLFFDEADSLFGKRTDVSDARDRYANLEVSYLLERMERFKGLAILATNRKRDLDEAFMRRIRYVIDFPVPDEPERAEIWKQVIPREVVRNSTIDVAFLARQFPLSGGHIRSVVFNACLQSARGAGDRKELFMKDVLIAVKREYDKMNRSLSVDQLGAYAHHVTGLE
ncbi:ATP-binding protein [Aquincola sp. S2]|uniref:ATP-binding protein n=1 Tax=Pseudaquabacterium terrae TaxID=2732868 RepID=A0ABX2ET97_9BURK|nr:AAA family ATPase [Aquabacterium terrae]NRF71725.1 ATP-binding protein [Aquabacterium terrae]